MTNNKLIKYCTQKSKDSALNILIASFIVCIMNLVAIKIIEVVPKTIKHNILNEYNFNLFVALNFYYFIYSFILKEHEYKRIKLNVFRKIKPIIWITALFLISNKDNVNLISNSDNGLFYLVFLIFNIYAYSKFKLLESANIFIINFIYIFLSISFQFPWFYYSIIILAIYLIKIINFNIINIASEFILFLLKLICLGLYYFGNLIIGEKKFKTEYLLFHIKLFLFNVMNNKQYKIYNGKLVPFKEKEFEFFSASFFRTVKFDMVIFFCMLLGFVYSLLLKSDTIENTFSIFKINIMLFYLIWLICIHWFIIRIKRLMSTKIFLNILIIILMLNNTTLMILIFPALVSNFLSLRLKNIKVGDLLIDMIIVFASYYMIKYLLFTNLYLIKMLH